MKVVKVCGVGEHYATSANSGGITHTLFFAGINVCSNDTRLSPINKDAYGLILATIGNCGRIGGQYVR